MKKRVTPIILVLAMLFSFAIVLPTLVSATNAWNGTTSTAFSGEGTKESPYVITSAENLKSLQEQVLAGDSFAGKYFVLANDIDLGNNEWTAIGTEAKPFTGVFDGKGFTVRSLSMTNYATYYGLFGYVKSTTDNIAVIANVTVEGSIVLDESDAFTGHPRIAGIVGETRGFSSANRVILVNCVSKVDVTLYQPTIATAYNVVVGGSIGMGRITDLYNCVNEGNFNINYGGSNSGGTFNLVRVGGIVGYQQSNTYTNCTNNGDIEVIKNIPTKKLEFVGGIIGAVGSAMSSINASFVNCVNNGDIIAENKLNYNSRASGIVGGFGAGTATIENCYNTGNITSKITAVDATATAYAGGIIAYLYKDGTPTTVTIKNSYNSGTITATGGDVQVAGGIVGFMNTETSATNKIENCATTTDTVLGNGTGTVTDSTSSISLADFNTFILPIDAAIATGYSYDFDAGVKNLSETVETTVVDETTATPITTTAPATTVPKTTTTPNTTKAITTAPDTTVAATSTTQTEKVKSSCAKSSTSFIALFAIVGGAAVFAFTKKKF